VVYVLRGFGSASAPASAAVDQVNAQLRTAKAAQQALLDQYNDAEFKNPPDRATQQRLDPLIAAANKRVNDLSAELRRLTGTKLKDGTIDAGELEIRSKAPSMLPWLIGGAAVVLAFGALSREKKPGIAPP